MTLTSCLIVPATVDALVVTRQTANDPFWRRPLAFPSHYRDPEPHPLDMGDAFGTQAKDQGVYLHWHLPEALGKGRIDLSRGDGPLWYPSVPDRWLILRYYHPDAATAEQAPQVAGWLVYSNFLSDKPKRSGGATSRVGRKQWMGCSKDLTASGTWSEPTGSWQKPLTVLGPGLPSFAAFQPYCQDVFSFHDPLADGKGKPAALGKGTVSYLVAGWHSSAADDPLAAAQVTSLLDFFCDDADAPHRASNASERLGWSATPLPAFTGAERSLYAGTVVALPWDAAKKPAPDPRPLQRQDIKVALGHDMADAMAALVNDSLPAYSGNGVDRSATSAFHAFHSGHLPTLEQAVDEGFEPDVLQTATHHDWFSPTPDGTWWKLTRIEPEFEPWEDDGANPVADDPTLPAKLAALNAAQHALDHKTYDVTRLKRQVSELWWLKGLYAEAETKPDFNITKATEHTDETKAGPAKDLKDARAALPALRARRDKARAELEQALPPDWTLSSGPKDPFYAPGDPTVLMRGAGTPLSDSLARTAALPCRWADQPLAGLALTAKDTSPAKTFTAPEIAQLPLPAHFHSATSLAPTVVKTAMVNHVRELHVLHGAGHYLAKAGHLAHGKRMREQERMSKPLPTPWPEADRVWQQPWRPLTLTWQVKAHTLPYENSAGNSVWHFDGSRRHLAAPTQAAGSFEMQGRSLISAVPTATVRHRIDQYRATYPGTPDAFTRFRTLAGTWNLASQKLTGLRAALTHRATSHLSGTTLPDSLTPREGTVPDPALGTYQSVEAAHIRLRRLNIVDTFGRGVLVVDSDNEQNYRPRRSASLISDHKATTGNENEDKDTHRYIELAPRLVQPARLQLSALSHTATTTGLDKVVDTDSDPLLTRDTPVAAWLVVRRTSADGHPARHFVLAVYSPEGEALGEVRFLDGPAEDGSRDAVTWLPLPGSAYLTPQSLRQVPFTTAYPALAGFLHGLVDADPDAIAAGLAPATERPARLVDLAQSVETTLLCTAHRPDAGIGAGMAAGRPLALVRMRLHLELDASPLTNPHWDKVFDSATTTDPRYATRRWPVRLGAGGDRRDGLVGYYTAPAATPAPAPGTTDYETLHAVHPPPEPASGYIQHIYDGADLAVPARPVAPKVDPKDAAYFTVLIDPYTQLSAHSDIQPQLRYRLPGAAVDAHLQRLVLGVRLGPALARILPAAGTPGGFPGRSQLTLPTPDAAGDWGFAARTRPPATGWDHYDLAAATQEARLGPDTPDVHSGYLTCTPQPSAAPGRIDPQESR
ncbi:hypothetical protein [Streptomyces sp. NPDC017529]|uniref:hypothetical protein n=1 Tax=Streptomyces sp. NPDC017529 TaxID=3365000 RepID=UPI0037937CED